MEDPQQKIIDRNLEIKHHFAQKRAQGSLVFKLPKVACIKTDHLPTLKKITIAVGLVYIKIWPIPHFKALTPTFWLK